MKIFIAGATGAIGCPLVEQLVAEGYGVVGMTQSAERAQMLSELGAAPAIVNAFDTEAVHRAIAQVQPEVVIEQLTALPKTYNPAAMPEAIQRNVQLRREGGANVLAAAQAAGVRRYIMQSSGFFYAPGSDLADEQAPFATEASPRVALSSRIFTETEQRLFAAAHLEAIALRYGFFYGNGTWYSETGDIASLVHQQRFPISGEGSGVWSFVHLEDAAKATATAVRQGNPGVYNIVNDQPVALSVCLPLPS